MDDKEKEKFGVIVDKNNQSEGEQPKMMTSVLKMMMNNKKL